ncbi:putative internal virion protein D [Ralstonia phage phiITL-1]|uniref:Putative internal virion protein D n=1 Tax=Ralstonia phage phiITL-1 TaxID=1597967 RepID=A0A0U1ZD49_9CAUD|nr:internal virion protein with endolysin domain [Ralstonia phage phiITL-1]AJT60789.1 putative internal virion protein D [Ralstonia phage phiITL-1]
MTTKYDALIQQAAQANGLDPAKLKAQIQAESNFDPAVVSKAGAVGIGQIMPKYWMGKHGLDTIEDFKNPDKAIPAMAAIMAGNIKQAGSWEGGLVLYNAGAGKGNKYLNAFKAGQYDLLPEETRGYLGKLAPTLGVGSGKAPGVVGLSDARVDLNTPTQVQGQALGQYRDLNPEQGLGDSLVAGLRASAIGTALRRTDSPVASLLGGSNPLTEEAMSKIAGANIGASGTKFVMRNAMNEQQVDELIELARENQASANQKLTLMGDLSYGVGEMLGDPVTYGSSLIPAGAAVRTGRLFSNGIARVASAGAAAAVEGAAGNLASEAFRESTTGVQADFAGAIAAGAAFGLGIHGVGVTAGWAYQKATGRMQRGVHRAEAGETTAALRADGHTDAVDPTIFTPMDIDAETGVKWKQTIDRSEFGVNAAEARRGPNYQPGQVPALLRTNAGDTLHTATGIQFSSANPLNPGFQHADVEMTARGVPGVEIGDVLGRTENQSLKDLFWNLGRATRGYTDGSSGKFGVTGQDVAQNMNGRFHDYQWELEAARSEALGEPQWVNQQGSARGIRQAFNEKIQRAMFKQDPSGLSKAERKVYDLRTEFYRDLGEQQVAPGARWGVDAPSLLDEASFKKNYGAPIIYDDVKVRALVDQIGADELQDLVARSFIGSYLTNPEVRKQVVERIAQDAAQGIVRDFRQLAHDVAYGIVKSGDPLDGVGISHLNRIMDSGVGHTDSTPGFRKQRNPFGHDYEIEVPGQAGKFSVADLFSYDTDLIDTGYFNRVRGDVALSVGTGSGLTDVSDIIRAAREFSDAVNPEQKAAVDAAEMLVNQLYGVGMNSDWARLRAVESIVKNLAFMKSSAFMGLSNFTEIAAGIREHGVSFAAKSIPGLGKLFSNLMNGKATEANMRLAQGLVWGRELDKAIIPSFSEAIEKSVDRLNDQIGEGITASVLGGLKGATEAAADKWWATKFLRATTGRIVETARAEFFADLARGAHTGKSSFANKTKARSASVDEAQLAGVLDLLRESTSLVDGELRVTNPQALVNDPRAAALRRYGQYWSERVIQQNTPSSTFRWAGMPVVGMLSQFQSFVMRSVNAKLIRGTAATFRDGDVGQGIDTFILGPVLAGLGYAGITYLRAQKFTNEEDRNKYLKENLGEPGDYSMLVAGGLKRSAAFGAIGNLHDSIVSTPVVSQWVPEYAAQYAGLGRTSQEAKLRENSREAQQGAPVGNLLGGVVENAPAVKLADSLASLAWAPVARVATPEDSFDEAKWNKGVVRAFRGLVPNDPVSQRAFQEWIADPM